MRLNNESIKLSPRPKITVQTELKIPTDMADTLAKNKKAAEHFKQFTPGKKKE